MEEKLLVGHEVVTKIQSRAIAIKLTSKDRQVIKEAEEILEIIENILKDNTLTLNEKIEKKMRDTKFSDPEMNANLYILYRKLSDGKISPKDAEALFQLYINTEPFDKKIY
ncbi:hypothetical protein [uncultured Clostridium sp.]|uniref:hypothetical protein n=1 Tax=uncultured Clostridium sp. TaxID=59620 RepID=UPI0028E44833|nr:hypothetical protein [uncultured Clostridium sp.]